MIWVIFQYDDHKKVYSFIYSLSNPSYFTFLERSMTRFSQRTYCKGSINSLREMTIASHFVVRIVSFFFTPKTNISDKELREGHSGLNVTNRESAVSSAYRCSSPVDTLSAKSLT